jgi:hypothetical protein
MKTIIFSSTLKNALACYNAGVAVVNFSYLGLQRQRCKNLQRYELPSAF